ncbi:hypothetical protein JKF63_01882 [Porcisia hertigi]|uniref:Ubiquitin-like domain-containing protein n=1 Tax=Porcisia hertigi TaxID=2761500 RepID=A0A836LB92_9TRYP|nr:hypothetical protein JKF63_01882 [Porcisia hertigi]
MNPTPDTAVPTKCIHVLSDIDGYKYKLVMQGDVQQLSVRKVKRYLEKATGIKPTQQLLSFNGVALDETMSGRDAGFFDGAILRLQQVSLSSGTLLKCTSAEKASPPFTPMVPEYPTGGDSPPQKEAPFADKTSPSRQAFAPAARSPIVATQLTSSANTSPLLQSLSPNQLAGGTHRQTQNRMSCAKPHSAAQIAYPFSQEASGPANASGDAPHTTPQGVSSSSHTDCDTMHACLYELEGKVAALSIDNVRLREQLQVAARHAAEACTDWKQEEEVKLLKAALAAAQQGVTDAERAAAHRWRVKEEDLVKELDLLREERRRFQAESTAHDAKIAELVHSLEGEIRGLRYELRDKDEALQAARIALSELQRQNPLANAGHRGGGGGGENLPTIHVTQPSTLPAACRARILPYQSQESTSSSMDELAETVLGYLRQALESGTSLELDPENDTCVVPMANGLKVLVTLDRETERMYLYVTLLNYMPSSPAQRLRLYEMLLDGALLGKDMAGGGVGVSLESNLILMSTSAHLRLSDTSLLAVTAPQFVAAAWEWKEKIDVLLNT